MIVIVSLLQKKSKSSRLFAFTISILSILLLNNIIFFGSFKTDNIRITDFVIPEPVLLLGPLIYFYCNSLLEENFRMRKSGYWHFLPGIFDLFSPIYSLIVLATSSDQTNHYKFLNTYDDYIVIPQFISLTFYLVITWQYLLNNKPLADSKTFKWARDFVFGVSIVNIIWFPFLLLYISEYQGLLLNWIYFHPIFYAISSFFYFLSYRILKDGLSFRPNLITKDELDNVLEKIQAVIVKDKIYRNPELTLKQLSTETNISAKILSFIFKHYYKKGFNQYINQFRIQEAFLKLENDSSKKFSIEGIALDVGFSSRSTFYRSFRQVTGKSPNEILKGYD
ncbi:helix-turn-helix domain-containing protein [Tunicatimonas pelagia]|uniref:helix-turn-helix domain-containing protein n=1 Tax=Tunicatimonas pelagia TaxID=931531 RepID=UPI00345D446D